MALATLESQANQSIQPSELSLTLGSSRTNATRIADELEKRGWIERKENKNDRRCLYLHLTKAGQKFLNNLLPPQYNYSLWSTLNEEEKQQLENLTRKLLNKLDALLSKEDLLN